MSLRTAFTLALFHPMGAVPHTVGGYRPPPRVKQGDHARTRSDDQRGGKAVDGLQSRFAAALAGAPPLA